MTTLTLDNATIDSNEFTRQLQRFISLQAEIDVMKEDMKEVIQEAADKSKMDKGLVKKYFSARYKAQTKEVAEQGVVFAAIDNLIDN